MTKSVFTEKHDRFRQMLVQVRKDSGLTQVQLAERLAPMKEKRGVYFVEILDAPTGKVLGAQLVDTGERGSISTMDERLFVTHRGFVEIYSIATGLKEGEIPGSPRAYSKTANLVSVQGENTNELAVYDLNSREKVDEFTFASDVRFDHFSKDGNRLLVVTEDQTAYFLDISKCMGQAALLR